MVRRKRASIKGRGADILFGEKEPPKKPVLELAKEEVDIGELLGEEAGLVEPVPTVPVTPAAGPVPPRATEIVSPPLEVPPSAEPRKVSVTLKVEEPPPSVAAYAPGAGGIPPTTTYPSVSPTPREAPPPPTMPDRQWEEAAYGPPPYVPEPAPAGVTPAALSAPTAPPTVPEPSEATRKFIADMGAETRKGMAEREEEKKKKGERELIEDEKKIFEDVPSDIESLYEGLSKKVQHSASITDYCLGLLRKARRASLGKSVDDWVDAEYYTEKVRAKVQRTAQSTELSRSRIWWLLGWQFLWLLISLGLALHQYIIPSLGLKPEQAIPLVSSFGWGGVGGVIGVLYNLPWFVQFGEYDPAYDIGYVVTPIKGLMLGAVVYLLFQAGLLVLSASEAATALYFVYTASLLAGFKQEYIYELLDSLLKTIFKSPPSKPRQMEEE